MKKTFLVVLICLVVGTVLLIDSIRVDRLSTAISVNNINNDQTNNSLNTVSGVTFKPSKLGSNVKNIAILSPGDDSYLTTITYVNSNMETTNQVFMDTFLVMGNTIDEKIDTLNKLEKRVAELNKKHNTNIKLNIILGFGTMKNKYKDSDTTTSVFKALDNEQISQIHTTIDNNITAFKNKNYTKLNLIGFYWNPESVNNSNSTVSMIVEFNNYVHNKGYKTIWIPYITGYDRLRNGDHLISSNDLNTACQKYKNSITKDVCNSGKESLANSNGVLIYRDEFPYYGYSMGFDYVSIQSNYEFHGNNPSWNKYRSGNENTVVDRLKFSDYVSRSLKTGIEVELDPDSSRNFSLYGSDGCTRYKEWMTYANKNNWNQYVKVYYIYTEFKPAYLEQGGVVRSYYDITYKYAKGNLTQNDINKLTCDREYYSRYVNVSKGKSYTTTLKKYKKAPNDGKEYGYNYLDANQNIKWKKDHNRYCEYKESDIDGKYTSALYCDDGIKLTDGKFAMSPYSTFDEWVVFNAKKDPKPRQVIVDLGKNDVALTYFAMELNNQSSSGVKIFPRDAKGQVNIYVSEDNKNYKYIGHLTPVEKRNIIMAAYHELKLSKGVSGRYVKFDIDYKGSDGIIMISEVIVGKTSTIDVSKPISYAYENSGKYVVPITMVNAKPVNLKATSSDPNVATAYISDNNLKITPLKKGTAVITITDKNWGTTTTHTVRVYQRRQITLKSKGANINGKTIDVVIKDGSNSAIPAAVKKGYTFAGWKTSNGTKIINADGSIKKNSYISRDSKGVLKIKANLVLYPIFYENSNSGYTAVNKADIEDIDTKTFIEINIKKAEVTIPDGEAETEITDEIHDEPTSENDDSKESEEVEEEKEEETKEEKQKEEKTEKEEKEEELEKETNNNKEKKENNKKDKDKGNIFSNVILYTSAIIIVIIIGLKIIIKK